MKGLQRSLKQRFDHRRLTPAFVHETQADLLDQRTSPVVTGDFVQRRQVQAVRQAQVIQPARIVKRDDIGPRADGAGKVFSKDMAWAK